MIDKKKVLQTLHNEATKKELQTFETGFLIEIAIHLDSQDYEKAAQAVLFMRTNYSLLFQLSTNSTDAEIEQMKQNLQQSNDDLKEEKLSTVPSITTKIKALTSYKANDKTEQDVLNFWRNTNAEYAEYNFTGLSSHFLMMVYMAGMGFGKELQKHQAK